MSQKPAASAKPGTAIMTSGDSEGLRRPLPPPKGRLYHGVHPGGKEGEEDAVLTDPGLIASYSGAVGHEPAFVYFSQEWGHHRKRKDDIKAHAFPLDEIKNIAAQGRIPFVRLMLRTSSDEADKHPEDYFTLENIVGTRPSDQDQRRITGEIRTDLEEWGRVAREVYKQPLIVEWGTEANNRTFHWNASNHEGDKRSATALFRKAFRYIVHTVSGPHPESSNIVWVFHVTAASDPDTSDPNEFKDNWNRMAEYFPDGGSDEVEDDVVDWLGVSIYGCDNLQTGECSTFSSQLENALGKANGTGKDEGLLTLSNRGTRKNRPIFILELGTALNYGVRPDAPDQCRPQKWIKDAFAEIFRRADEGTLAGFSWWNERFEGEGSGHKKLEMRFDHLLETSESRENIEEILIAYRSSLNDPRVIHAPVASGNR
jgi:hypothetical protein